MVSARRWSPVDPSLLTIRAGARRRRDVTSTVTRAARSGGHAVDLERRPAPRALDHDAPAAGGRDAGVRDMLALRESGSRIAAARRGRARTRAPRHARRPGGPAGTTSAPRRNWPLATTTAVAGPSWTARPSTVDARPASSRLVHRCRSGATPTTTMFTARRRRRSSGPAAGRTAARSGAVGDRRRRRPRSDGPGEVGRRRRAGTARARRGCAATAAASAASSPATSTSAGPSAGWPHGSPFSIIRGSISRDGRATLDAATTPRLHPAAASRRGAASCGVGCDVADCPSRSMHCFTLRTKSPPVISSSSSTSASGSPATHSAMWSVNPGSGPRVSGSPASSSLWLRSRAMRSIARTRARRSCSASAAAARSPGRRARVART